MKVSLALSGGGVRALAHLGIVKVLQEHGFEIAAVSGSSGGALVGALLCDGKSPEDIVNIMKGLKLKDLAGTPGSGGFFTLERIETLMRNGLDSTRIEEMPIPFTVACTDLEDGCIKYFQSGPAARLCIASSSLVPIFSPLRYGDRLLADGGFMDNMPVKPLKCSGYPVIGINVNPIPKKEPGGIIENTIRALMLMMRSNVDASRQLSDFYIEPEECADINIFDLKRGEEAFDAGVKAARSCVLELESALKSRYECK